MKNLEIQNNCKIGTTGSHFSVKSNNTIGSANAAKITVIGTVNKDNNLIVLLSWFFRFPWSLFFASVGNLLDKQYKTGGYEQGRRADYRALRDDVSLTKRVFGPKYWYGRGVNYFVNVYLRF